MAYMNINAPTGQAPAMAPLVRTDDLILPRIRWVPIGKSNCYLDLEKSQSNPIYKIALDEQWFFLTNNTLKEALQITPVNNNQAFATPPSSDALINFVNELGYLKLVRNLSNVVTNDMFQPWRALTKIINLCLTEKTSGFERPKAPEEFTQSIHTFIEDKRNLTRHTSGKKKATLIVISSIRFTKLIIHHLQRRHKFHPRPDSPLHLTNEEPVLGYLKFSAKSTKREVFGMPIPGSLITADIQEDSYYQEYLAKVAQHRRYLAGETWSNPDSPASKPTKPSRKPKSTAPKAPPRPSVSTPGTSAQPAPTSAPAKHQEKKRKQTTETSEKPSKAKKSKYGFVPKKRTLKSVDKLVAEDKPAKEPQVYAEDADIEKELEENLKSMYDMPRGLLPPVVIREPESGKYQPLPEVPRKGKAKSDSEEESDKVVPGDDEGGRGESQVGSDPGAQAEGQTGPDADPGNAGADEQSIPSPAVHTGSDREHMDIDVADEPASSLGTLSSLQHLSKDICFGDLFFSDKPSDVDNDKANAKTEVKSMMSVPIQQDMSSIPPMTSSIIDITSRPESPKQIGELKYVMANLIQENKGLEERLDKHGARLYKLEQLDIPHQVSKALYEALEKSMNHDHSQELTQDLAEARKKKKKLAPPPPPLSSTNQDSQSKGSAAPSSSKTSASVEYQAWTMTGVRLRPSISLTPVDLQMDEDMAPDEQAQSSDDKDIGSAIFPRPAFEIVKVFHPDVIHLQYQMEECHKLLTDSVNDPILRHNVSKPLQVGGPPGQVTIQIDFFFNKDLEYLRYGSKGSRPAFSISKMNVAYYPDAGLEQMVPDQFWIEEECKYDIAAIIEVFSMYGYEYMKKIVLRRADLNEHVIMERDFRIESYQTQLNLTKPQWDATGFKYKHDYTVIDSPRAVMFQDKYEVQMMMRFNEIHKFSDGMLQQIDEALDYRVKEFRINRINPGLNTRFWTRKDVDRSKEFMLAIQKWLKTRRIF
nr:histone deacetylase 14 [Tanacetum cinerariifolium]